MTEPLLHGINVVEVADPLTEHAGRVLAELGATVWLVEPPGGSATRQRRPYAEVRDVSRRSIPFLARNAGKRSVVLDGGNEDDRRRFATLARAAQAVLLPGDSGWRDLLSEPGEAVQVTIDDPLGLGPSSLVPFAASGGLSSSGWPHQPPCNAPAWLALDAAGVYAAGLVLVGLWMCHQGQPPPRFTVPLHEAGVAGITPWTRPLISYGLTAAGQGVEPARLGPGPYPFYECLDGYVRVLTGTPRQWQAWVELLGHPAAFAAPEWSDARFRAQNADAIYAASLELTQQRRRDELFHGGQRLGLTITPVLDPAQFLRDPHVAARGLLQPVDDPDLGSVQMPRAPYRFSGPVSNRPPAPAPALGANSIQLPAPSPTPPRRANPDTADPGRPLAGIRVLNLGVGAVVPELASLMALLGAEAIKIESRRYLDFLRRAGIGRQGEHDGSPSFNQLNLGVLSCAVDLATEAGRELVRRLAARCDVVLENMRGPVVTRWGLDYAGVRAVKPDIIYLSSQGLGEGPYGGYQTYGPNLQAFSCVTALWAHPDDPFPVGTTLNHPDHLAGKQALAPLLAALLRRDRTGEGTFIDAAQFEFAASLLADKLLQEQVLPGSATPLGNRSLDLAPHGCYPCKGEDAWCALAVCSDEQWQRLRGLIPDPRAQAAQFETATGRLQCVDELDAIVGAWTAGFTPAELESLLRAHGVPASRIVTGFDLVERGEAHHGGLFAMATHPLVGSHWYTGLPFLDGDGRRPEMRRPPLLGEHTEYVLYKVLGLPTAEVSRLLEAGVVGY
ncbi:MAG TPA: CoA transferase [Dehalococcoidia bacterium]|nr:CoA transferase [Dehalococcoidia bacterium]